MAWLNLAIVLIAAIVASFGASFLSSGWKKRRRTEPETLRIEAILPGYDCGLCARVDCRAYAAAIDRNLEDPALCLPGGSRLESRLRALLAERRGDPRGVSYRAVVRCGGRKGSVALHFDYDGLADCASAALRFGSSKKCKEGCLGLGSCVSVCPLGAIRVSSGLAVIDPVLCTGCGRCVDACPPRVISLIPREQRWFVACSSQREGSYKSEVCSAACTGCGECFGRSGRSEFRMDGSLARENAEAGGGRWADIAKLCPNGAIVRAGAEKNRISPFPKNER